MKLILVDPSLDKHSKLRIDSNGEDLIEQRTSSNLPPIRGSSGELVSEEHLYKSSYTPSMYRPHEMLETQGNLNSITDLDNSGSSTVQPSNSNPGSEEVYSSNRPKIRSPAVRKIKFKNAQVTFPSGTRGPLIIKKDPKYNSTSTDNNSKLKESQRLLCFATKNTPPASNVTFIRAHKQNFTMNNHLPSNMSPSLENSFLDFKNHLNYIENAKNSNEDIPEKLLTSAGLVNVSKTDSTDGALRSKPTLKGLTNRFRVSKVAKKK